MKNLPAELILRGHAIGATKRALEYLDTYMSMPTPDSAMMLGGVEVKGKDDLNWGSKEQRAARYVWVLARRYMQDAKHEIERLESVGIYELAGPPKQEESTNEHSFRSRADEYTEDYIRRELWGDKMSKPRTKDEVLEFLKDNPESAEKLLELVASIACDAIAGEEEENDLPISPGKWYVGGEFDFYVYAGDRTDPIAKCLGPNAKGIAKAIAALPELLRAVRDHLSRVDIPWEDCNPTVSRMRDALKAALT